VLSKLLDIFWAEIWVIHLEQKNICFLAEELLSFFSIEILVSSNWHAYDYDIWYQTTCFILEKYDVFSWVILHFPLSKI
jgi:hypothetical protein